MARDDIGGMRRSRTALLNMGLWLCCLRLEREKPEAIQAALLHTLIGCTPRISVGAQDAVPGWLQIIRFAAKFRRLTADLKSREL